MEIQGEQIVQMQNIFFKLPHTIKLSFGSDTLNLSVWRGLHDKSVDNNILKNNFFLLSFLFIKLSKMKKIGCFNDFGSLEVI